MRVFTVKGDHQLAWINPAGDGEGVRLSRARGTSAAAGWRPLRVELISTLGEEDEVDPPVVTDCPYLGAVQLLLSARARDVLAPLLEPEGEFLPVEAAFGAYWIYNCLRSREALDEARSVAERFPDGDIKRITRHELRPEVIGQHAIFHLDGKTGIYYATDRLVAAVERAGLTGFVFTEVWSSESGGMDLPTRGLLNRGVSDEVLRQQRMAKRAAARERVAAG
ncbi:hypothetical protein GXW71_29580 [Roseomonas hellenica]|uniref:Immunity MXAN-0049 protein domain-containing protein n=1 Tax=Plastoroseomonas hellenica TaxID=2687306 RepID=A0ABS5F7J0_9PROT|nr:DUF1629 domain-containing protein [Plastoroseomonas hellenica]MBR0668540.1 hypothetical protein [Plastoroseomonas hellenica]